MSKEQIVPRTLNVHGDFSLFTFHLQLMAYS